MAESSSGGCGCLLVVFFALVVLIGAGVLKAPWWVVTVPFLVPMGVILVMSILGAAYVFLRK